MRKGGQNPAMKGENRAATASTVAPSGSSSANTFTFRKIFRVIRKLAGLGWLIARFSIIWLGLRATGRVSFVRRAQWFQRVCRTACRLLGVEARFIGEWPADGVLVCNHLSYLDIIVLASRGPIILVSKSEVRKWPFIGFMASLAGTIFVRRDNRTALSDPITGIGRALDEGARVGLFPEGTSSDGSQVLPFRSSLLEAGLARGAKVTPAFIEYRLPDGIAGTEVCYWGEMTFFPHLLHLMTKERIQATVIVGDPAPPGLDRKELARVLREQVIALAAELRHPVTSPAGTRSLQVGALTERE